MKATPTAASSPMATTLMLKKVLDEVAAVPPATAAEILGVSVRTVYRRLHGDLERIPRGGRAWVSVRSLRVWFENQYGSTRDFNELASVAEYL